MHHGGRRDGRAGVGGEIEIDPHVAGWGVAQDPFVVPGGGGGSAAAATTVRGMFQRELSDAPREARRRSDRGPSLM